MKIYKTKDLNKFKTLDYNRVINEKHVNKLRILLEKDNQLEKFPICVTPAFEVIDGQHRLAAARELKLEVFYVIDEHFSESDLLSMNSNRLNWSMLDYINYWADRKGGDYLFLKEMIEGIDLPVMIVHDILNLSSNGGKRWASIKLGKFEFNGNKQEFIEHLKITKNMLAFIKDNYMGEKAGFLQGKQFFRCLHNFLHGGNVSLAVFQRKVLMCISHLRPCLYIQDYKDILNKIYGFKTHKAKEVKHEAD